MIDVIRLLFRGLLPIFDHVGGRELFGGEERAKMVLHAAPSLRMENRFSCGSMSMLVTVFSSMKCSGTFLGIFKNESICSRIHVGSHG